MSGVVDDSQHCLSGGEAYYKLSGLERRSARPITLLVLGIVVFGPREAACSHALRRIETLKPEITTFHAGLLRKSPCNPVILLM
jgi:hypothetical protein